MAEDFERIRRQFLPDPMRVLFIGESPPHQGTFFYKGNSNLYTSTRAVLEQASGRSYNTPTDFLRHFQALGCYLDDLCLEPVNQWKKNTEDWTKRVQARRSGIASLAQRIQSYSPNAFIIVMLDIETDVCTALKEAGRSPSGHYWALPFPLGERNKHEYQRLLGMSLLELSEAHILAELL